jgi:hypothetical protein
VSSSGVRADADRGAGLLSTMFGALVFLIFLLFSAQLLLGLFTRTIATDAAQLGAQRLARGASAGDARGDVEQVVGPDILLRAGPVAAEPDVVRYEVAVKSPGLLGAPWMGPWATDEIVRQGYARLERFR